MASINETFIFEVGVDSDSALSACTGVYTNRIVSCEGNATIFIKEDSIETTSSIIPLVDAENDLGTPLQRFRQINSVNGYSSVWSSSEKIITPELDLGEDDLDNHRVITANNSIIQNDILTGGSY
jgi:hypothetical protein